MNKSQSLFEYFDYIKDLLKTILLLNKNEPISN